MAALSIEALDRFDKLEARVATPMWPSKNWFAINATTLVAGLELHLYGDLDGLSIPHARVAYRTVSEKRREDILVSPTRSAGGLVWRLPDAQLRPPPDAVEEVTFNPFDVFGTMKRLAAVGDESLAQTISVALVAVGLRPHSGVLLLRASALGASGDDAEASLPFTITT
jgi:hypothetical protein